MITVKKAIEELQKFPLDASLYAYEGEMVGIVVVAISKGKRKYLGYIYASELDSDAARDAMPAEMNIQ